MVHELIHLNDQSEKMACVHMFLTLKIITDYLLK